LEKRSGGKGDKVAKIHFFGVKYATEILESGASGREIAKAAGIEESYGTEVNKGVKLAKFVQAK
jgi:5-methylcytosine-specific restriction protein B